MNEETLYGIIKEIADQLKSEHPGLGSLPQVPDRGLVLERAGFDLVVLSEVCDELESRLGKRLDVERYFNPESFRQATLGQVLDLILQRKPQGPSNPLVVYVDDEEDNLFVFRRRFGKELNLKTFLDPKEALDFIRATPDVALVVTDEVMPGLGGNELCDEVRKTKPNMKFILITGNPNNDGDLLYKSLRYNRFYEFINKPMDLEGKGEQYLKLIAGLIERK